MNNKVNRCILIKRSLEKGRISEAEFEQLVADWACMSKMWHFYEYLKFDCNRGWDLITKALPEYMVDRIKYSIEKPALLRKHRRWYLKAVKDDIKTRRYYRTDRYVIRFRNDLRKFIDDMVKNKWRKKYINYHFGIHYGLSIPEWVNQSDKTIKRKVKNWDKKLFEDIATIKNRIEERKDVCYYCANPLDRRWYINGNTGVRKPYVILRTKLTQDIWATLAELKNYKSKRRQMKFSEEKFRQEQYVKEHGGGINNKEHYHIKKGNIWDDFDAFADMFGVNTGLENDGKWDKKK